MGYEAKSSVLGIFHRSCSLIYRAFSIFVIVSLVLLTCLIFYQVIMRDLFNAPPTWTEELALVIMVYLAIVGGGWGIRDNIHIYVELAVSKLPRKARMITELLALSITLVFLACMVYYGIDLFQLTYHQTLPATKMSVAYTYLPVSLAGVVGIIFCIEKMVEIAEKGEKAWTR